MPTLEWIGKQKVINHHQEFRFGCWISSSSIHMERTTAGI